MDCALWIAVARILNGLHWCDSAVSFAVLVVVIWLVGFSDLWLGGFWCLGAAVRLAGVSVFGVRFGVCWCVVLGVLSLLFGCVAGGCDCGMLFVVWL